MVRLFQVVAVFFLLCACAGPSSGPSVGNIRNATLPNSNEKIPISDLANASAPTSSAPNAGSLSGIRASKPLDERQRKGDVIEVTILDTGEQGLFSSTESRTLNLGRFAVDENGFVTFPLVGRKRVTDSTPENLQRQIAADLRGSAVNPQAVVTVMERPTSTVTVNGGVRSAGRFQLTSNKERVLDAIALAGGAVPARGATMVTLVRGSDRASVPLDRILAEESQNVRLLPGDQIFVGNEASSFIAFGAFKSTGEFDFEPGNFTLAQALGRAGGLLDDQADARNVYLFRNQPDPIAVPSSADNRNLDVPTKPVIYRINLHDVANFMLMQRFQMLDGDLLYAPNSGLANAAKLLTVFKKSPPLPAAPAPSN